MEKSNIKCGGCGEQPFYMIKGKKEKFCINCNIGHKGN